MNLSTEQRQQCDGQLTAARRRLGREGFSEGLVDKAIRRCENTALSLAGRLSPNIRDQGYLDLLAFELLSAEKWCRGVTAT